MHKAVVLTCVVGLAILVAATAGREEGGADFTFNNDVEVNSLDPHVISWKHDIRIANALFEGLMAFEVLPPDDGGRVGRLGLTQGVAERVDISDGGLTYTFHLRRDARWSNGEPVTAGQFRWSFRRVLTPLTAADYAGLLFVIDGARAYYEALAAGRDAGFDSVGVRAIDARTLEVRLAAPCPYFLELTAFPPFFPVYPPLLEAHNDDAAAWTKPGVLVGNGPFVLESHRYRHRMVLRRSAHYWDRANVGCERIAALAIDDTRAALNAYESRQCDMITSLPPAAARALTAQPSERRRGDYIRSDSFGTYFYRFNCQPTAAKRPNPFADPRVRRAFAMAVDRSEITAVTGVGQREATTFIPPTLTLADRDGRPVAYEPPAGQVYDPDGARALLAEAGYPGGAELGEIRMIYNTGGGHEPVAQRLASIWQQELDVAVTLMPLDGNAFGAALKAKSDKIWHIGRGSWFGDYRDPSTFLEMFGSDDGNNDCGYADADFDALLRAAAAEGDPRERLRLFARAESRVIVEQAAILPLYHYVEHTLIRPHVRGAWPNAMGYTILKQIRVER
ncbi:MAG: peptide ABC transporter substrate-binding protein [Planctomycetes bacterium]|nr:peptide ABC transporter substrate-binding protein [Planctomycetota bacterium]